MDKEFSLDDPTQLLEAASDFAHYPGAHNDEAAKEFLDRFPLPLILNCLQTKSDVPGLENTLVNCLERLFKTRYGTSLIPHYVAFLQIGLQAPSQAIRSLACKTVGCLLESPDQSTTAAGVVIDNNIYPLLLDCLINGNEEVAGAAMDTIKTLVRFKEGVDIVFPANSNEATHLRNLASRCSSLGRIRVLALIVKLFSVSSSVASAIYSSSLINLLEEEFGNSDDTLVRLNILELFYELVEISHATEVLSKTSLLQLLSSIISDASGESILRTRAMMISGRLLSGDNIKMFVEESYVRAVISAIDSILNSMDDQDVDEHESALEALGQIGSSIEGAALLLLGSDPIARHLVCAAFDKHTRGRQLAALHSLGNLAGEVRPEDSLILDAAAEESLRHLIYDTASKSPKFTPSGLFLSVLQQDAEIRLAGYRTIAALVARPWCLMEIISKAEIVDIVTNPAIETTKIGMEARYNCCKAIYKAFSSSNKLLGDPALAGIATKVRCLAQAHLRAKVFVYVGGWGCGWFACHLSVAHDSATQYRVQPFQQVYARKKRKNLRI